MILIEIYESLKIKNCIIRMMYKKEFGIFKIVFYCILKDKVIYLVILINNI